MDTKYEMREDLWKLKDGLTDNHYSVRETIRDASYDLKNDIRERDFKIQNKLINVNHEIQMAKLDIISQMYSIAVMLMINIFLALGLVVIILY